MAQGQIRKCGVCSAPFDEKWTKHDNDERYICRYCGNVNDFSPKEERQNESNELNEIYVLLDNAHFKTACENLTALREKYPKSSKVFFLSVLAENCVCFTKDNKQEGHYIPTLNDLPDGNISNSLYAKKALELAESDLVREAYKMTFDYIENLRVEIQEAAKKKENQYDIFISTKVTLLDDNGQEVLDGNGNPKESPDCANARTLYNYIKEKYPGKRVFFSQTDDAKVKMSGQKYENVIYSALHSAKAFILVAESRNSIDWRWVRNEWMRYLRIMEREENKNRSFVLVTHTLTSVDLPGALKDFQYINYNNSADPGASLRFFLNNALSEGETSKKLQAKSFDGEVGKIELNQIEETIVTRKLKTKVEEASEDVKISLERIANDLDPSHPVIREKAFKQLEEILEENPDVYEAKKLLLLKDTNYYHFEDYINNPAEITNDPSLLGRFIEIAPEKEGKKAIESLVKVINGYCEKLDIKGDDDVMSEFTPTIASILSLTVLPYLDVIDKKLLKEFAGNLHKVVWWDYIAAEDENEESVVNSYLAIQNYIDGKDPNKYIEIRRNLLEALESFIDKNNKCERIEAKLVSEILKVNPADYKTIWFDFCYKRFGKIFTKPIDLANEIDTEKVKLSVVGDKETIETFKTIFRYSPEEERERFTFTFLTAIVWDQKSYEKEPGQDTLLLTKDVDGNNQIDDYEKNGFDLFKDYIEYKLPEKITYNSRLGIEIKKDSPLLKPNINAYLKKEKPNVLDRLLCYFAVKMHNNHFYEQAVVLYDLYLGQQETNKTLDCLLIRYYQELANVRIAIPEELKHVNRKIQDTKIKNDLYALSKTVPDAMVLYNKINEILEKQERYYDIYVPISELVNQLPREKTIDNLDLMCKIRDGFNEKINAVPNDVKKDLQDDFSYEIDFFDNKLPLLIKEKQAKTKKKKAKKTVAIVASIVSAATAAALILTFTVFIPQKKLKEQEATYNDAMLLLQGGDYEEAAAKFKNNSYADSNKLYYVAQAGVSFQANDYESGIQNIKNAGGTVSVVYDNNGGTSAKDHETIRSNKRYIENDPSRQGYNFQGWDVKDFTLNYATKEYSADLSLRASWNIINYTITYNLNGGSLTNPINEYNIDTETFSIGTPEKTGYSFDGWTGSNGDTPEKVVTINKGTTGDKSYTANFTANEYTVTFDYGYDSITSSDIVTYDQNFVLPSPSRVGYAFDGWYFNDQKVSSGIWKIAQDLTLLAHWKADSYQITLINNNPERGTVSGAGAHDFGSEVTLTADPNTGYSFIGWFDTNDVLVSSDASYTFTMGFDLTLTAKWNEGNEHIVTLIYDDGTGSTDTVNVQYGKEYSLTTPSRNGYQFDGWFDGNSKVDENGTWLFDSNKTLTAHWTIITYSISYELNSGTNSGSNPSSYTVEDNVNLSDPSRDGYQFDGWYNGENKVTSIPQGSTGNITLTAVWEAKTYVVTLDPDGGTIDGDTVRYITYDSNPSLPTPVKEYHSFEGWYYGDTKIGTTWKIASNCTIKAKWKVPCLEYLTYTKVSNSYIKITGVSSNVTELVIPETIDGKPVTEIAANAFQNDTSIQVVVLPDSITKIGEYAFNKCTSLTTLILSKNLSSIGSHTFIGCSSLQTIKTKVDSLTNFSLAYLFTTISHYISDSQMVKYPASLTNIIVTSGSVVPSKFFAHLPSTVTNAQFVDGITEVKDYGFWNCKNYLFPNSIVKIGEYSYSDLGTIGDSFTVHEGLKEIGAWAFSGSYFKTVNLPSTLTSIGRAVFAGGSSTNNVLKTINFNGTKAKWQSLTDTSSSYDSWAYNLSNSYTVYCTDAYYVRTIYGGTWYDL